LADLKPGGRRDAWTGTCVGCENIPERGSVAERREADEMARAAQRMAEAADRMAEVISQLQVRTTREEAELLTEEEADLFALAVVHRAREELRREVEGPTPTEPEIKDWVTRRDELRQTEEEH
jgi:hypothetical protein